MTAVADLYRYYDRAGALLYIGESLSSIARAVQHQSHAAWWDYVASFTREKFESKEAAQLAERDAIAKERPAFNVKHNVKHKRGAPSSAQIRKAREAAGLSQTAAAELLCVTLRTWQNWEAGSHRMRPVLWDAFLAKVKTKGEQK